MDEPDRTPESQQTGSHANHSESESSSVERKRQQKNETEIPYRGESYPDDEAEKLKKLAAEVWGWIKLQNIQIHQWIIAGASVATFVATTTIACIYWSQFGQMTEATRAAMKSADVAEATLTANNRPWLDLTPTIKSDWTVNALGEGRIAIQMDTSNIGHSPAVRVASVQDTFQVILLTPDPWTELKKTCDAARDVSANPHNRGVTYTIFPGKPYTEIINEGWSPQEMVKSIANLFPGASADKAHPDPYFLPVVAWCVAFRSDFDPNTVHRTGYVWQLWRKTPEGLRYIKKNATVPANEVVLKEFWPIGPLAD